MPVKAVLLIPTILLVAAGFAIYDNREQFQRLFNHGRRRIALKLRELADELVASDEDEVEIEEFLRSQSRRNSAGSARSVRTVGKDETAVQKSGVEVHEETGALRRRTAGPSTENEDQKMQESFLSAASHQTRESTATLSPLPVVLSSSPMPSPRDPIEPANPFESGYDTQHSSPTLEPAPSFSSAAYWDVNDWVHSTTPSRSPRPENANNTGALTPTSDDDGISVIGSDTASVVSEPSMAGSGGRDEDVKSLDGEGVESEGWSEVGSEVSEGSERRR